MKNTIDADDILNAIYEHAQVKFECEGCGDDSRDGSKLARKKLEALIAQIHREGYVDGLHRMDNARNWLAHAQLERGPNAHHARRSARDLVETLRGQYAS